MENKLKNLPPEQRDLIMTLVTKNPKLFEEIALKIKKKTDAGANETMASVSVMKEYAPQIQKLMKQR